MKLAIATLLDNHFRYVPVGLLRIISYIKKTRSDIDVRLIDKTFDDPEEEMARFRPDILGINTYSMYYKEDVDFCKKMKERYPNLIIIAGGPQMTTMPESMHEVFDYGIVGQGEISLVKLIDAINKKVSLNKIGGLIYRKDGKLIINPVEENVDFDELAKIDYSIINKKYFKKRFIPEDYSFKVSLGIMTSVGCPFKCPFCSIRFCWKKPIYRKIDAVVEEIKDLYTNYNVRNLYLYDDLFAINKQRLREFKEKMDREGLLGKITFCCCTRADIFDEEMCQILKELNVVDVSFGFESGSTRILKYIKSNPNITVKQNEEVINLCVKYGLNVGGSIMIGVPGEKKEDIEKTIEFMDYAKRNGASRIIVFVFTLFPKTEMWELAKREGKIDEKNIEWEDHTLFDPRTAKMLDNSITMEEYLNYYKLMKKKSRGFMYKIVTKTLLKNPANAFYFMAGAEAYIKRYFYILKH